MKKITIYLYAIISLALLISCGTGKNNNNESKKISKLDSILQSGVIRVGTTGDWVPMSMKNTETNEYTGRDIDLVKEFAKDMGVEVEFVKTDWKSLVAGIISDRYDITTTASLNMGRAKSVGFTLPFMSVDTVALVQKDLAGKFNSWEDLNDPNVTVAVTLGTVFDELVSRLLPEAQIIRVEAPAREFQEVQTKNAIASITDSVEAALLKKEHPEAFDVVPGIFPHGNILGLLTPRDDQEFINYLNVWIQLKQKEGYFDQLNEKWLE